MEENRNNHPEVLTIQQIIARTASQQEARDAELVRMGRMSSQRYQELQRMREGDLHNAYITLEGGDLEY